MFAQISMLNDQLPGWSDSLYLQCSEDQKSGKVDPDDHVKVILLEDVGEVADDEEDDAGDEHDQDVADQRTAEGHSDFDAVVYSQLHVAHHVTFHCVLG